MKITIHAKPITLNNCYKYATRGRFVTSYHSKKYKELKEIVDTEILQYKKDIKAFFEIYDEAKHFLICNYIFYYKIMTKPKTKKDTSRISKNSMDLSNIVKPIEDLIFDHFPVDDSQVLTLNIRKIDSEVEKVDVEFSLGDL